MQAPGAHAEHAVPRDGVHVPFVRAEPILQLAINILGVGSIMVSLLDGERKFVVKSAAGFVPPQTMLTPPGICHWSLVPQVHQMVVIEDTLLDARRAGVMHPVA